MSDTNEAITLNRSSWWRKIVAVSIDWATILAVVPIVIGTYFLKIHESLEMLPVEIFLICSIGFASLMALFTTVTGHTPGQKLMSVGWSRADGRRLPTWQLVVRSIFLFFLGYWVGLFSLWVLLVSLPALVWPDSRLRSILEFLMIWTDFPTVVAVLLPLLVLAHLSLSGLRLYRFLPTSRVWNVPKGTILTLSGIATILIFGFVSFVNVLARLIAAFLLPETQPHSLGFTAQFTPILSSDPSPNLPTLRCQNLYLSRPGLSVDLMDIRPRIREGVCSFVDVQRRDSKVKIIEVEHVRPVITGTSVGQGVEGLLRWTMSSADLACSRDSYLEVMRLPLQQRRFDWNVFRLLHQTHVLFRATFMPPLPSVLWSSVEAKHFVLNYQQADCYVTTFSQSKSDQKHSGRTDGEYDNITMARLDCFAKTGAPLARAIILAERNLMMEILESIYIVDEGAIAECRDPVSWEDLRENS